MADLSLALTVPAKINLWLEILNKRPDGYHDLSSLMLPIGVYDQIEVETGGRDITVHCDHPQVPEDETNLAWRAAHAYLANTEQSGGCRIRLRKSIPVGAGLGGGSADAAAVLLAMNELFGRRLSREQLCRIASRLGADVAFFIQQTPALATGIGENLECVAGVPEYPLVLVKPALTVSTGWVYGRLKLTRGGSRIKISAFLACPWQPQDFMENDLESVTLSEYPLLSRIKQWMLAQGALGALMSGSGPTVFGIFAEMGDAERVGEKAKRTWDGCWVKATKTLQGPVAGFR